MFGWLTPRIELPEPAPMFTTTTSEYGELASLTLLVGGSFVLGRPRGATDEETGRAVDAIKLYLNGENGGIVLPWPVSVDDQREAGA